MATPRYPLLYQINTRVWLTQLSAALGRRATLDDIPDTALDQFARQGFDWIWLLSVWQTGPAAAEVSRANSRWRREFEQTLPDLRDEDIAGSGFAIQSYTVHRNLGGGAALAGLRSRMHRRGLKLMLDFVPNHVAADHRWLDEHPDFFVHGSEFDLVRAPKNYCRLPTRKGGLLLAHGRDPNFDGWSDTLQLNYGNPELQQAMIGELNRIAEQCDGVRCDMAMLVLPEVFERTWGIRAEPFWPKAIESVRRMHSQFLLLAEVYWDLEWTMHQQGFDYAYDKRLYDRLLGQRARPVREHFVAGLDYQDKLARFLENHDEPRAASAFPVDVHKAAAILTFLSPGLRFLHHGQLEGRRKHLSPHLIRAPVEPVDGHLKPFYDRLLNILLLDTFRNGSWQLLQCDAAQDGNDSCDNVIAFDWHGTDGCRILIAVNYSPNRSQCRVRLPHEERRQQKKQVVKDLMSDAVHEQNDTELVSRSMSLDLPAWGYHVFRLED